MCQQISPKSTAYVTMLSATISRNRSIYQLSFLFCCINCKSLFTNEMVDDKKQRKEKEQQQI